MSKRKSSIKLPQDPIAIMIKAVEFVYPDMSATVVYMDDEFFAENGRLEWSTTELEDGRQVIFLNPNRTVMQVARDVAKGAAALRLNIIDPQFDESDIAFIEEVNAICTRYNQMVWR